MNKNPNNQDNIQQYNKIPHSTFHDTDPDTQEVGQYPHFIQGNYAQLNSFQNNQAPHTSQNQDIRVQQHLPSNQGYPTLNNPNNHSENKIKNQVPIFQSYPPQGPQMVQQNLPPNQTNPNMVNYSPSSLEFREETLSIQMPQVLHQYCFQKLFPRKVSPTPMIVHCPACNQQITTKTQRHVGVGALGCTLGLVVCCPQICWLPFCIKDCHDLYHRCPDCGYTITQEKFLCK